MKKLITLFLSIFIILSVAIPSFAQASALFREIKYEKSGSQDRVTLITSSYKGYNVFYMSNPDRLVVDIPNNLLAVKGSSTISINSTVLKSIRFSQFTKTSVRVVFDLKGKQQYKVEEKNGSLIFVLGNASAAEAKTPEVKTPEVKTPEDKAPEVETPEAKTPENKAPQANMPNEGSPSANPPLANRGEVDRPSAAPDKIDFAADEKSESITVSGLKQGIYKSMRLTNPDRIVFDITGGIAAPDQNYIPVDSNLVRGIRYTQLDGKTARLEIETNGQPHFSSVFNQGQLVVTVKEPTYRNFIYSRNGDTATVTLPGVRLEENVDGEIKKLYTESIDAQRRNYAFSFYSGLVDVGTGIMQIGDGMLDTIAISRDLDYNSYLYFNSVDPLYYSVSYDPESNSTIIHISKGIMINSDKLVVIDPGHGGHDPGASYGSLLEKDLNLKIALKVNEILKSMGVRTYMTRTTDTFVELHDRAKMANDLNASFFLSIHNNSYYSSEYGTETLCYPSEKSRQFASIIQNSLVKALGTKNRGIIERPNLVVLYATKMPAALAEIAFISNANDRMKLQDENFLNKAAQALADAVIQAITTI